MDNFHGELSEDECYTLVIPKEGELVKVIHDIDGLDHSGEWLELRLPKSIEEAASNMDMTVEEFIDLFGIRR